MASQLPSCLLDWQPHSQGEVHVLTSFTDVLSNKSYLLRVNFIYQMKQRNVIITVGDDEDLTPMIRSVAPDNRDDPLPFMSAPPSLPLASLPRLLRVWNYEKMTKEGSPTLARSIPAIIPNARQSAVRPPPPAAAVEPAVCVSVHVCCVCCR